REPSSRGDRTMNLTQPLRAAFGSRVRASRRGKSRQSLRHRLLSRVEFLEDRVVPATLTVTSLADSGPGTLRDEIVASVTKTNGGTGNDTIQFDHSIDGGTIELSTYVNDLRDGTTFPGPTAFHINSTLVIDGETGLTKGITIARDSSTPFRFFFVDTAGNVT